MVGNQHKNKKNICKHYLSSLFVFGLVCRILGSKAKNTVYSSFLSLTVEKTISYYFEGVAKSRKTLSIDRPGKGIERGRCTRSGRRLTCTDVRGCRASLAIISATGGLLAAVPCVLFLAFTHISNSKLIFANITKSRLKM